MQDEQQKTSQETPNTQTESTQSQQAISELVSIMQTVDINSIHAKQNETSMDDNNGGRITYTESIADKIF